jgi:hypothetical protein
LINDSFQIRNKWIKKFFLSNWFFLRILVCILCFSLNNPLKNTKNFYLR